MAKQSDKREVHQKKLEDSAVHKPASMKMETTVWDKLDNCLPDPCCHAKFKVDQVSGDKTMMSVTMSPVEDCEENKAFFGCKPGGTLNIGLVSAATQEHFKDGGTFLVHFTKVTKEE